MEESDIYSKTSAGADELKSRERRLQQRLRTMLIMIDGSKTVAELRRAAAVLGAPEDFLQTLLQQGLIAMSTRAVPALAAATAPAPLQVARSTAPPAPVPAPAAGGDDFERFTQARQLMNDTAVDALGFRAFLFTLKLERCSNLKDLGALLPEFEQSLTRTRGESYAGRVGDRVRALLG